MESRRSANLDILNQFIKEDFTNARRTRAVQKKVDCRFNFLTTETYSNGLIQSKDYV